MLDKQELARFEKMNHDDLIAQIIRLDTDVDKYCKKADRLHEENRRLRMQPSSGNPDELNILRAENVQLKAALANQLAKRGLPGAGRKRKAGNRELTLVCKLHKAGHSLSEISRLVEAETGISLSRTTVWNLIHKQLENGTDSSENAVE